MKKLPLFLVIALYCFAASAQDIVLTFNAADPEKTIDSIKVTNVESGNSATVIGETTVDLQTVLTSVTGIQNPKREITVYPNPFKENATLEYSINKAEEVTIQLSNSLGQTVASKKVDLYSGTHRFNVSTANTGIYYVAIHSSKGVESSKIIALSRGNQCDKIDYLGYESSAKLEKSALVEAGKLIHMELSSGNDKTIIADTPTESKTYEVEFHQCEDADGKNYKIVQIGEQWWMAENLTYNVGTESVAYDDDENNIVIFGRLYSWESAKIACPVGWHLPSDDEWEELAQLVSDRKGPYNKSGDDWQDVGKHLQTTSGWYNEGNGTDDFGFSGLPGGYYYGGFRRLKMNGYWWSSTDDNSLSWILNRYLQYSNSEFYRTADHKDYHYSVRCVKD